MTALSRHYIITFMTIYLLLIQCAVHAFPLALSWNEGKSHFLGYANKFHSEGSLYEARWNHNYERYAKKLAMGCGDEYAKIDTLLDVNIYTSIMDDLNWDGAYQEWAEGGGYEAIYRKNNFDTPAYVGCASEKCGQQTYHVCTFNKYFIQHVSPQPH